VGELAGASVITYVAGLNSAFAAPALAASVSKRQTLVSYEAVRSSVGECGEKRTRRTASV
jgi:hypothetical protein